MNEADEVLRRIDYPGFYRKHIPGFNSNGRKEVLSLCPFHEDKEPSFSVNTETGLYFCHACGEKGNAIKFLQRKDGIDFKEALQRLKAGEGITDTTPPPKAAKKAPAAPPKTTAFLTVDQIGTLHRQLTKNEKVLKEFMSNYGLDLSTIERYLIGYQNERFVIPIEFEPGKWTFKEHKGSQLKGSQVSLYPARVIKEKDGLPFILIAEGEFKALLLNQFGFPAVSGTGGANTWKREWSPLFQSLNVIMAYDNDEPGRQGAQRVAEALSGTAKSVKAIQWPAMLDGSKDKKDVTDFFVTLGKTKEDFQRLIDNAEEIGRPIKELDGHRFVEPDGFQVEASQMMNTFYVKDMPVKRLFSYAPVLITGRAIDIDDGTEEVELTFKKRGKWRPLLLSKRVVSDARKIIEFADYNLPVDSNNAKKMVEYLSAFDAYNGDLIPNTFIARSTGWKTLQDKYVFVLNRSVSRGAKKQQTESQGMTIDFRPDNEFERFVKALTPEGTYPKWREVAKEVLQFPVAAFAFYASFAAPLLKILNAPSFIIHFWGNTSVGKTTVLELASSIWGNPHKDSGGLVFGWESTPVFLERMAGFFCDMPIFPDDSQNVEDKKMSRMLYQLANSTSKGRGSITAIQRPKSWRTVVFSTGEKKLTECTTYGGAQARTLELYGPPFANADGVFISELKQTVRENYGHAGPKFIEGLLSIMDRPNELTALKAEFRRYHQSLSREAGSMIGDRIAQYFSVIKLAADLVHRFLNIGDPVDAEETIFRVFNMVQEDARGHSDMPTRAMHDVISWVSSNMGYFKESDREQFGRIAEHDYIGIFRRSLREVLRKDGYAEMSVLRGWSERDWIKREDPDHYDCARRVKTGGMLENLRLVIIPWKVFRKFTSGDEDDDS